MARPIYSANLFTGAGIHIDTRIHCPTGKTMIIREISTFQVGPSAQLDISDGITDALFYRHSIDLLDLLTHKVEERHIVIEGLDVDSGFVIKPYDNNWDVVVSGYVLNGIWED